MKRSELKSIIKEALGRKFGPKKYKNVFPGEEFGTPLKERANYDDLIDYLNHWNIEYNVDENWVIACSDYEAQKIGEDIDDILHG